jgi:hypothetical protein
VLAPLTQRRAQRAGSLQSHAMNARDDCRSSVVARSSDASVVLAHLTLRRARRIRTGALVRCGHARCTPAMAIGRESSQRRPNLGRGRRARATHPAQNAGGRRLPTGAPLVRGGHAVCAEHWRSVVDERERDEHGRTAVDARHCLGARRSAFSDEESTNEARFRLTPSTCAASRARSSVVQTVRKSSSVRACARFTR